MKKPTAGCASLEDVREDSETLAVPQIGIRIRIVGEFRGNAIPGIIRTSLPHMGVACVLTCRVMRR